MINHIIPPQKNIMQRQILFFLVALLCFNGGRCSRIDQINIQQNLLTYQCPLCNEFKPQFNRFQHYLVYHKQRTLTHPNILYCKACWKQHLQLSDQDQISKCPLCRAPILLCEVCQIPISEGQRCVSCTFRKWLPLIYLLGQQIIRVYCVLVYIKFYFPESFYEDREGEFGFISMLPFPVIHNLAFIFVIIDLLFLSLPALFLRYIQKLSSPYEYLRFIPLGSIKKSTSIYAKETIWRKAFKITLALFLIILMCLIPALYTTDISRTGGAVLLPLIYSIALVCLAKHTDFSYIHWYDCKCYHPFITILALMLCNGLIFTMWLEIMQSIRNFIHPSSPIWLFAIITYLFNLNQFIIDIIDLYDDY